MNKFDWWHYEQLTPKQWGFSFDWKKDRFRFLMDKHYDLLFYRWIDETGVRPDTFKQEREAMLRLNPVVQSVMKNEFIIEQNMFQEVSREQRVK